MSDQTQVLCEIKQLTQFLEKSLDHKVLKYILKSLTKPGDNYRSVVQSVEVETDDTPNSAEVLKEY